MVSGESQELGGLFRAAAGRRLRRYADHRHRG
jgi:hypothetical protein